VSTPPTAAIDKVRLRDKLVYGAAGPVDIWATWVPLTMAYQVFNMALGLSPALISFSFAIFRIYDAIIDPLMGWISDNTRSRWGRRRPYVVVGAVLTGVAFPLIWLVQPGWSHAAMTAWLIIAGIVFFTFITIWNMPYQSMLLEMTGDYNERTSVTSFRAVFQNLATVISSWVWAITQLPFFFDESTGTQDTLSGIRAVAVVMGILIILLGILPGLFLKERHYAKVEGSKKEKLLPSLKLTLRSKPFLLILAFSVLFSLGTNIPLSFGPYITTFHVCGGDQGEASVITGMAGTIGLALAIGSLPLFNILSRRIGKTRTLGVCACLQIVGHAGSWWLYNPEFPSLVIVQKSLIYIANAGLWVMLPSMVADTVDFDELSTGERREGSFASIFSWILKVSMTLGLALSGPFLEWSGFRIDLGPDQPVEVMNTMRLAFTIIPTTSLLLAGAILFFYKLGPARMAEIRSELEGRRGAF
jgi:glycoside/pentoside/hexuronide:cation symporter, GPH family